jgi:hypothetical protein
MKHYTTGDLMKLQRFLLVFVFALLITALVPQFALAAVVNNGDGTKSDSYDGVKVTVPTTYSYCVNAGKTDYVKIEIPANSGYTLKGWIQVSYIVQNQPPQVIETKSVNTSTSLTVELSYPSPFTWPVANVDGNGLVTKEVHVDLALELYNANGVLVYTFGPGAGEGLGWDVFCVGNFPPPTGNQGCTPGYWKQPQHFDSWPAPYLPTTPFNAVFGVTVLNNPNLTLVQALGLNGGGINALARHSVAAFLNAASSNVAYRYEPASAVVTMFQNALVNNTVEATKNLFDAANNGVGGCPLN